MTFVPPRRSRRLSIVLLLVGALLVLTAALLAHRNVAAPTDAGQLPPATTAPATTAPTQPPPAVHPWISTTAASPSPPTTGHATSPHPTSPVPPPISNASVGPSASVPPPSGRPMVLHLPTLNVTAHVDPVDSSDGVLQVPEDISRVGWWQHSAHPGSSTGSTVLDGHIDSAVAGEGALFHLAELAPGDPITVTTSTSATIAYRVQARRVYVKQDGLPADLFTQQGPARLVIISCGGTFNKQTRSYEENIAIYATPAA